MIVGMYSTGDGRPLGRYINDGAQIRAKAVVRDPQIQRWADDGMMQLLDEIAQHRGITREAALQVFADGWSDGFNRTRLIEA